MKTKLILLLSVVLISGLQSARAVLLIFPSGQTNTLTIPAGETWKFDFVKSDRDPLYGSPQIQLVQGGITNLININEIKVLSGAMRLIFSGENQFAIAYKKMNLPGVQTLIVRPGETNTVDVPSGKTMRVIQDPAGSPIVVLRQGTNTFRFSDSVGQSTLDGPCTLELGLDPISGPLAHMMVYTFNEDFVAFPQLGYLQTPPGNFEIVVEKTTNLTNWFPVLSHNTTTDQRAYYRFRIAK